MIFPAGMYTLGDFAFVLRLGLFFDFEAEVFRFLETVAIFFTLDFII